MKNNDIKKTLSDLKEQISADSNKLNTKDLIADENMFPQIVDDVKYIDYTTEQLKHNEFASQVISNIINTYIISKELLSSPRLNDLKQTHIMKLSRLLLMINIAESNLIKLQEYIDMGDVSKDMFDSVNKAQQELRNNMNAKDKHLIECESYWKSYADEFGFENEEEKMVHDTTNSEDKLQIIDMSDLNDIINKMKESE